MRGLLTGATLDDRIADAEAAGPRDPDRRPVREYTATLVEGVRAEAARIDELLDTYTEGWPLDRMPAVDRNILRIGTWELLHNREVPPAVVISEAVGLAASLSTAASPGFVNGMLARLRDLAADA